MSTDLHVTKTVRRDHPSPYTMGQFHARYPWVLPVGAALFALLALGAASDLLFWDKPITRALVDLRTPTLNHIARRVSWFGSTKVVLCYSSPPL